MHGQVMVKEESAAPRYRVLIDYEVNDPHPLVLHTNSAVECIRKDAGWPGWVWVQAGDQTGWMPEDCLHSAEIGPTCTTKPFDGTELSARRGEILTVVDSAPGWILGRKADGSEGWFPLFNLRPDRQT